MRARGVGDVWTEGSGGVQLVEPGCLYFCENVENYQLFCYF